MGISPSHDTCPRVRCFQAVLCNNDHYVSEYVLKRQLRGANAMREADTRAKILRELATRKMKSHQRRLPNAHSETTKQSTTHQRRGVFVTVLSLLRRKNSDDNHTAGVSGNLPVIKTSLAVGPVRPLNAKINPSHGFEIDGKSIKTLSLRDVLERQERQSSQ